MSLSSWLRDYVFTPLGGVARRPWKQARNLLITMALCGLWHGAAWTFVVWGIYHGVLMAAYGTIGRRGWDRLPRALAQFGTFLLVLLGWVIFRANTMHMAGVMFRKMFVFERGFTVVAGGGLIGLLLLAGALAHGGPNSFELKHEWGTGATLVIAVLFILCMGAIYGAKPSPFLYFQF
jgi:alginate O-acetyltransferase complex protein AlgI